MIKEELFCEQIKRRVMNLNERIAEDLKSAMKEKNALKLSVLRVLKGEIQRSEQSTGGRVELTDADIVKLIKKLIDCVREADGEVEELTILESYMPEQLSEDEIKVIISIAREANIDSLGGIMKYFKDNYDGKYDGKLVSTLAR